MGGHRVQWAGVWWAAQWAGGDAVASVRHVQACVGYVRGMRMCMRGVRAGHLRECQNYFDEKLPKPASLKMVSW